MLAVLASLHRTPATQCKWARLAHLHTDNHWMPKRHTRTMPQTGLLALPPLGLPPQPVCGCGGALWAAVCRLDARAREAGGAAGWWGVGCACVFLPTAAVL